MINLIEEISRASSSSESLFRERLGSLPGKRGPPPKRAVIGLLTVEERQLKQLEELLKRRPKSLDSTEESESESESGDGVVLYVVRDSIALDAQLVVIPAMAQNTQQQLATALSNFLLLLIHNF